MEQLTFIPTTGQFFLFNEEAPLPGLSSVVAERLAKAGWPGRALLAHGAVVEGPVDGTVIELLDALPILAGLPAGEGQLAPPTVAVWSEAARIGLDLVLRGRLLPRLRGRPSREDDERVAGWEARWAVALEAADRAQLSRLGRELGAPMVAQAVGRSRAARPVTPRSYGAPALLRRFLDVCADTLVREASRRGAFIRLGGWPADAWEQRLVRALGDDRPWFSATDADPELLAPELRAWADAEAEAPTLLPSPPSWRAPETLQAVLRRLVQPAARLGARLCQGEPAPRTLAPAEGTTAAKLSQSIAVTRAILQMTGGTATSAKPKKRRDAI